MGELLDLVENRVHALSVNTPVRSARCSSTERPAGHLLDAVTRVEPYVVLVRGPQGMLVRKLTVAEKLAHSEQTGASVFMADETEQEEFFGLLGRRAAR